MTIILSNTFNAIKTLLSHLWLSISSINFYLNVYRNYVGYGIKYLFTVTFFSSLIYCFGVLGYIIDFKKYILTPTNVNYGSNLEYIVDQLPEIYYDGKNISIKEEGPLYLYDGVGDKVALIDLKHQVPYKEKIKIPALITSDKLFLLLKLNPKLVNFPIPYWMVLGSKAQTLSHEVIKNNFIFFLNMFPKAFIYIISPLFILIVFLNTLFETFIITLMVYLLSQFLGPKSSLNTCSRMMAFSSGVYILFNPLVHIFFPAATQLNWLLLFWPYMLVLFTMLKIRHS